MDLICLSQAPLKALGLGDERNGGASVGTTYALSGLPGGQACKSSARCWNSASLPLDASSSANRALRLSSLSTSATATWRSKHTLQTGGTG